MTVHLIIVGRNEAHRYLSSMLEWHAPMVDTVFYYDDQSTDASISEAKSLATVVVRPDSVPSFLENEAAFRQAAWWAFEKAISPQVGDWVLSLDADEFLSGDLALAVRKCEEKNYWAYQAKVSEVFDWQPPDVHPDDNLMIRTDGYWGAITATRLVSYQPYASFTRDGRFQPLGGGSVPSFFNPRNTLVADEVNSYFNILHMGYALEADRQAKYARYEGKPGHNPRHIASIIEAPTLHRWGRTVPRIWLGQ